LGADARQIGFLVAFDFPKLLLEDLGSQAVLAILLVAKSNGHIFRSLDEVKSGEGRWSVVIHKNVFLHSLSRKSRSRKVIVEIMQDVSAKLLSPCLSMFASLPTFQRFVKMIFAALASLFCKMLEGRRSGHQASALLVQEARGLVAEVEAQRPTLIFSSISPVIWS
jgi:hypothetical protein